MAWIETGLMKMNAASMKTTVYDTDWIIIIIIIIK